MNIQRVFCDPGIVFCCIVLYQAVELFLWNTEKDLKFREVLWVSSFTTVYCLLYLFGSFRWLCNSLGTSIGGTDDLLWKGIETIGFITFSYILLALRTLLKKFKDKL
jgi:hypothetical protein